ncbi:MAG TPA: Uma2 family endonuclease [Azospirillum sp.]
MSDPARHRMTVEEFLVWDDGTDTRYELIRGEPVAMAPPGGPHSALAGALTVRIGVRLRPPCRIYSEAGIRFADRNDLYFQADIAVSCRPLAEGKGGVPDPTLIVEVLSPSTTRHDAREKLPLYRQIPSVQEILLIDSTRRRAEMWHREGDAWRVQDIIGDGALRFHSLDVEIAMADLYEGVL